MIASSTHAHFFFSNPPFRGDDEDTMTQPPCGGSNVVNTTAITPFPVTEGQVTTDFEDGNGVLVISYAPTSNDTFVPVSGNVTVNVPVGIGPKQYVTPVDLSKAGAKSGDQGVLQAFYTDGVNTTWYQCADIKVVDAKKNGASSIVGTTEVSFFTTILISFLMALLN
ncbi:cytokine inducing-glycoprotein [Rhizophagus clarus]|uniref:Cytokine inducing-glycoprotein n=1 Tax=Rhizophagus clarus TaxID=94130 RepID=A0A8H3QDS8_9GLOM|nr:cytokine inducing-glycoprotein [Rhizophagus clarus]